VERKRERQSAKRDCIFAGCDLKKRRKLVDVRSRAPSGEREHLISKRGALQAEGEALIDGKKKKRRHRRMEGMRVVEVPSKKEKKRADQGTSGEKGGRGKKGKGERGS